MLRGAAPCCVHVGEETPADKRYRQSRVKSASYLTITPGQMQRLGQDLIAAACNARAQTVRVCFNASTGGPDLVCRVCH